MPIPDDAFFEAWEADLSDAEKKTFHRDGVVDDQQWANARVKVLFVHDEPTLPAADDGEDAPEGPFDLREAERETGGTGSYGTPMARWASMIIDGLTAEQAQGLKKKDLGEYAQQIAHLYLKKTGGGSSADAQEVTDWVMKHDEKTLEEIDKIDPQVIVVCGTQACTAWPIFLADDRTAKPVFRSQEFEWEGKSILATLSPSAPGTKTADKDADAARFAESPEIAALR